MVEGDNQVILYDNGDGTYSEACTTDKPCGNEFACRYCRYL